MNFKEILEIEDDLEFLRAVHRVYAEVPGFKFRLKKIKETDIESFAFEDVKKLIEMDWEKQEFTFLEFDEREGLNLNVFSDRKEKPDRIIDGGFRMLASKFVQENFGIVKVTMKCYLLDRNERNLTHISDFKDWLHEEFYLWDYEKKEYAKVPEEDKKKKRTGQEEEKADPRLEQFKERTELIPRLLHRTRMIQKAYFNDFDSVYVMVNKVPRTTSTMVNYLDKFNSFLGEKLEKGLITRLILQSLDLEEYVVAMDRAAKTRSAISACKEKIAKVDDGEKDFTIGKNRSPEESVLYEEYLTIKEKWIKNGFDIGPENPRENTDGKGYFVMQSTPEKIFPNFTQIEKRRYRMLENLTPIELEDALAVLKIKLNDLRMVKEQERSEELDEEAEKLTHGYNLLTKEQYEEILKTKDLNVLRHYVVQNTAGNYDKQAFSALKVLMIGKV